MNARVKEKASVRAQREFYRDRLMYIYVESDSAHTGSQTRSQVIERMSERERKCEITEIDK